jgi:hypothetical protein
MEENKIVKNKNWWMIGFLILLGILIGIYLGKGVMAIELDLNKNQSCALFNYSGVQCDSFWCTSGLKGNWSADEVCIIYSNISITNITNVTVNGTDFNESWIRDITRNETYIILNGSEFVNRTEVILVKNGILTYVDNVTEEQVIMYLQEHGLDQSTQKAEPMPQWVWAMAIIALCALAAFGIYMKSQSNKKRADYDEDRDRKYPHKKSYRTDKQYISKNLPKPKQELLKEKFRKQEPVEEDQEIDEEIDEDEEEEELP